MQLIGNDIGVVILPVHRLKLRWLGHRWLLLSGGQRRVVEMIEREWQEWGNQISTPQSLILLNKIYEQARQYQRNAKI